MATERRDINIELPLDSAPMSGGHRMTAGQNFAVLLTWFSNVAAVVVAVLGAAVLVGWFLNIAVLKSVLPGLATMKVNSAIGFIAAAMSLWLLSNAKPGSVLAWHGRVFAVLVTLIGGLTIVQEFFGYYFHIDELIVSDDYMPAKTLFPGRMSPASAINFLLVGLALLAFKARRSSIAACTHWVVVPPLLIAVLAAIGYAYGVNSLYKVGIYTSMALHTALSFILLTLALLASDTKYGFTRIAISDTSGGLLSRWLLPTLPVMIFSIGWLRLNGELAGYYEFEFGLALMVLLSITVCVIAVAWIALVLHRTDRTRKAAENEIRSLNAGLEKRVTERTQELAQLSDELSAANKSLELLSQQDAMTGLANRRHFDSYLDGQLNVTRRYNRALGLVLFDVDFFKAYNDHYGHPAGDECLKQVAQAIRSCCRRPSDLVARYGGEEFAMILPDTGLRGSIQIAEAARAAVMGLNIMHEHSAVSSIVTISGGVATALADAQYEGDLIAAADKMLYDAKDLGRNRVSSAASEVAYIKPFGKALRNDR